MAKAKVGGIPTYARDHKNRLMGRVAQICQRYADGTMQVRLHGQRRPVLGAHIPGYGFIMGDEQQISTFKRKHVKQEVDTWEESALLARL